MPSYILQSPSHQGLSPPTVRPVSPATLLLLLHRRRALLGLLELLLLLLVAAPSAGVGHRLVVVVLLLLEAAHDLLELVPCGGEGLYVNLL